MEKSAKTHYTVISRGSKKTFFTPQIWYGMKLGNILKLWKENHFRFDFSRSPVAALCLFFGLTNNLFSLLQTLCGTERKAKRTEITHSPIFILGHWRSGTTFCHELFTCDSRLGYADNYACFCPEHFLISRWLFPLLIPFPKQRPQDAVQMSWQTPQEEEFALSAMGLPSVYHNLAFPNEGFRSFREYLDLEDEKWEEAFTLFLKRLTLECKGRRLVLKSPPHTARIATLRRLFPDARFVHIHRNPLDLYPSIENFWYKFSDFYGFQAPRLELENFIIQTFETMYSSFFQEVKEIPANRIAEISFEELVTAPLQTMGKIYETLELEVSEGLCHEWERFCAGKKQYRQNVYQTDNELLQKIGASEIWEKYGKEFGYF